MFSTTKNTSRPLPTPPCRSKPRATAARTPALEATQLWAPEPGTEQSHCRHPCAGLVTSADRIPRAAARACAPKSVRSAFRPLLDHWVVWGVLGVGMMGDGS